MREITVICIADMHGCTFPKIPPCDILLLAGDCTSAYLQPRDYEGHRRYMQGPFTRWLDGLPARHCVAIAGNHDLLAEQDKEFFRALHWHYLEDESICLEGLIIHGSPWSAPFFDWAFMLDEDELEKKWACIPDDCDILLTHSPPYGLGDVGAPGFNRDPHTGSPSLRKLVDEHKTLKLSVFGHIHEGYGQGTLKNGATWVNATLLDGHYEVVHKPTLIKIQVPD